MLASTALQTNIQVLPIMLSIAEYPYTMQHSIRKLLQVHVIYTYVLVFTLPNVKQFICNICTYVYICILFLIVFQSI